MFVFEEGEFVLRWPQLCRSRGYLDLVVYTFEKHVCFFLFNLFVFDEEEFVLKMAAVMQKPLLFGPGCYIRKTLFVFQIYLQKYREAMKGERQIEAELSNLSSEVGLSVRCSLLIIPYTRSLLLTYTVDSSYFL